MKHILLTIILMINLIADTTYYIDYLTNDNKTITKEVNYNEYIITERDIKKANKEKKILRWKSLKGNEDYQVLKAYKKEELNINNNDTSFNKIDNINVIEKENKIDKWTEEQIKFIKESKTKEQEEEEQLLKEQNETTNTIVYLFIALIVFLIVKRKKPNKKQNIKQKEEKEDEEELTLKEKEKNETETETTKEEEKTDPDNFLGI